MNNLFQNKKIMIAAGVCVGVIILAIIIFIAIGVKDKKQQKKINNEMHFANTTTQTEEPENVTNVVNNNVPIERPSNEEVLEDLDEEYSKPLLCFADALLDKDGMKEFIEEYFATQGYLAYVEADFDDGKMLELLEEISDEDIEEYENSLKEIPDKLAEIQEKKQGLSDLSNSLDNTTSDENSEEIGIYITEVSEVEQYNEDDERFSRVYIKMEILDNEKELIFTFFDGVIINITDSDGNQLLEVIDEIE